MESAKILEILEDWNFWKKEHETGILREDYLQEIKRLAKTKQVIALMGVRRSGKSTIMRQYIKQLMEQGVTSKNILYVNFEDMRFKELDLELLQKIYEVYVEYLKPDSKPYIFLDEIHKIKDWEKFARTLHELQKANIFVSGSNNKFLFGELASILTGRHLDITIFPLDFKSFLRFNKLEIKDLLDSISKKHEIKSFLRDYLQYGGFPLVCLEESKKALLQTYFEDIINKDVVENHTIEHVIKLKSLAKFYLTHAGRRISFNQLSKTLGLSLDTIERYSYYLEEAYLIYFIKKFSYSIKEQERTMAIVYAIDNGFKTILGFSMSKDEGWQYQNTVAHHLIKKYTRENVFYWMNTNQEEVDFVIKQGTKITQLIQVCHSIDNEDTKKREIRALLKASKELKCNNLNIITEDYEAEENIIWFDIQRKVHYIPLWKWLITD